MVRLRPATMDDSAMLLELRNERGVREASFTMDIVEPDEHHAWLTRKLADPSCLLCVVEHDGAPIGQVRLDLDGEEAELSISLFPAERGHGLGRQAIGLAIDDVPAEIRTVKALVKMTNAPSLAVFKAAGFARERQADGVVTFTFQRP